MDAAIQFELCNKTQALEYGMDAVDKKKGREYLMNISDVITTYGESVDSKEIYTCCNGVIM